MALCGALGRRWSPVTPRHFAWQAWHNLTSTFVSRGRRGTISHPPSFCVAGVALMGLCGALGRRWSPVTPRHFALQAWRNLTSTFVSRGRRGTISHPPSFCVAGVALMALCGALGRRPVTPRHFAWQAWHNLTSTFVSRGRRGTISHPPSFCVAGVALLALCGALGRRWSPVTPRHFAWQAWHNLTSTFVSRGRRGTISHPPSFCVAGVALMGLCGALGRRWSPVTPRHFPLQAWHNLTSTFVSRGRRGTISHPPSFCVAGVALMALCGAPHHLSHTTLSHTTLSHTILSPHHFSHTSLSHTPSFTPNFVKHHLSHTIFVTHHLSHTIFDTPSFTPNFVKHHLWHTIFHTPLCHTPLCHTPSVTTPFFTHHLSPHHFSHTTLPHTIFHTPSFTHHLSHNFVTCSLSHRTFTHTIFHHTIFHTPLCHTPSFTTPSFTHHFVTHHLAHTPSFTHNFVTHHLLTHNLSHTTLSHTIFRHAIFHTPLCHTPSFTHSFVTRSLSHTTFTHTIFHTLLCHTHHLSLSHHLSHTTLSHTTLLYLWVLHHILCLSFFPRPGYNIWFSLLEDVALWGYPVL